MSAVRSGETLPDVVVGRARMRDPEWLPEVLAGQGDTDNLEPVVPAILERFNAFVERLAAQARDLSTGAYVQRQEDYTLWPPAIEVPVMGPEITVTPPPLPSPTPRVRVVKVRDTDYRPWGWRCACGSHGRRQTWGRALAIALDHVCFAR